MARSDGRNALFISHATPADNAFARWLGAKLAASGYEVWADILRLKGAQDWSRELEIALRQKSRKMLLVCTEFGLSRDGVRAEIEIASQVAKEIGDPEFIIPLRLSPYQGTFRTARFQHIDFENKWMAGLAELAELLEGIDDLPRSAGAPLQRWLDAQREGATTLRNAQEPLISNWLKIARLPKQLSYCVPPNGLNLKTFQEVLCKAWPAVPFKEGALTFTAPDAAGNVAPRLPGKQAAHVGVEQFLASGWPQQDVDFRTAHNLFADLGNQAVGRHLRTRKLTSYESSGGRLTWWANAKTAPEGYVKFDWPGMKGSRLVIGRSDKRKVTWHYGVSSQVRTWPTRHLKLSGHLIFTENGLDAIADIKRMHRLRRSFAKWRNARWRDMQLAFLYWLAKGTDELRVAASPKQQLAFALPPMSFMSAVSVGHIDPQAVDEDDPDTEGDDFDLEDFNEEV